MQRTIQRGRVRPSSLKMATSGRLPRGGQSRYIRHRQFRCEYDALCATLWRADAAPALVDRGHSLKSPTHGLIARARRSGAIGSDRLNLRTASPGGGGSVPCRRAARQARARRRKPRHCPLDLAIKRSRLQDAERENRPWFSTSSRYQAQPLSIISSIRSLSMSIASCPIGAHASRRVAHDRCGKNRAPIQSLESCIDPPPRRCPAMPTPRRSAWGEPALWTGFGRVVCAAVDRRSAHRRPRPRRGRRPMSGQTPGSPGR
jgi:hypothetical protein